MFKGQGVNKLCNFLQTQPSISDAQPNQPVTAAKQMSKDSILSLYSQNQSMNMQHNPYAPAGELAEHCIVHECPEFCNRRPNWTPRVYVASQS